MANRNLNQFLVFCLGSWWSDVEQHKWHIDCQFSGDFHQECSPWHGSYCAFIVATAFQMVHYGSYVNKVNYVMCDTAGQ